jgi:hypothetical protein
MFTVAGDALPSAPLRRLRVAAKQGKKKGHLLGVSRWLVRGMLMWVEAGG